MAVTGQTALRHALRRCASCAGLVLQLGLVAGCPSFQQAPNTIWGAAGFVQLGEEKIYVHDRGKGPALLLIHGYGAAHDTWLPLLAELARDHRVLAVDLPGFGRSDKYAGDYSPSALADKLFQVLDRKGIKEAQLIAHSWGSSIALSMALQQPARVKSLTLISAWVYEEQLPPFLLWARAPWVGEILYTLFYKERLDDRMSLTFYDPDRFATPETVDNVRRMLDRPGAVAAALAAARGQRFKSFEARYRTLAHPVLLIWGRQDRVSRLQYGERLLGELRDARLVVVERCGHVPMFEQTWQVLRALRDFLSRTLVASAPPPPAASGPASLPGVRR